MWFYISIRLYIAPNTQQLRLYVTWYSVVTENLEKNQWKGGKVYYGLWFQSLSLWWYALLVLVCSEVEPRGGVRA